MAGIGLHLRRLMSQRTLASFTVLAYYGFALAAGPWLASLATLSGLLLFAPASGLVETQTLIRIIVYAFCASSILAAPWVVLSVRYASDQIYARRLKRIPAGVHACLAAAAFSSAVGMPLIAGPLVAAGWSAMDVLALSLLAAALAAAWVLFGAMAYVRWVRSTTFVVGIGAFITVVLSGGLLRIAGHTGALWGYAVGWLVMAGGLYLVWRVRCPWEPKWDNRVFRLFRFWTLIAAAWTLFQLGLWIDKIFFWMHRDRVLLDRYDQFAFLSVLSLLPALAYFLIQMETSFVAAYRTYLARLHRATWRGIQTAERQMRHVLWQGLRRMGELQLLTTMLAVAQADDLTRAIGAGPESASLLRWLLLGAAGQVLLMAVIVLLLYFERRWEAFWTAAAFCSLNLLLSAWSLHWPVEFFGLGYALAANLSWALGAALLHARTREITYLLFADQPLD